MTQTVRAAYRTRALSADREPSGSPRRATAASALSFVFPGLGQLYNRQPWLGLVLGLPVLLLIAGGVGLYLFAWDSFVARLFDAGFLIGLMALNGALLTWRLVAILQAHARRSRFDLARGATYLTIGLALAAMLMHAVPALYGIKFVQTLRAVALGGDGGGEGVRESFFTSPGAAGFAVPEPSDQPDLERGERVNVLLVGLDSLPTRTSVLTDTMLVVSLDPDSGESAMISIPRDLYGAPLPDGATYDDKLNSLMTAASGDPARYPLGGVGVLKATISELLGQPIHYFAAVNLFGFKEAVDAIGGVDVQVERAVADPHYYNEYDALTGFYIEPGPHHMDGSTALAFVRSRQGEGDNDFTRAARQQQMLEALRQKLTAGSLLANLPGLLDAVRNTIATDVPQDRFPQLARAVQEADISRLEQAVLEPPEYVTPATGPGGAYVLIPDLAAIRRLADDLLGS